MATFAIKTVISAVDNITGPLAGINKSIKGFKKPFIDLGNSFQKLKKEMGFPQVAKSLRGVSKAYGGVANEVKSLGTELAVVTGAATAAVSALAWRTSSVGDAAAKTAQKVGVSTQAWTELAHAGKMSGVAASTLQGGLTRLNKNISEAARGGKNASAMFDYLGISVYDSNGKLKTADAVMGEAADKLNMIKDGAHRSAIAAELFGRSAGPEMLPLLKEGSAGIEALRQEAIRLGITFSDQDGKNAEAFGDSIERLQGSFDGMIFTIGKQILPTLTGWADRLKELVIANQELVGQKVAEWLKRINDYLPTLEKKIEAVWEGVSNFAVRVDGLVRSLGGWEKVLPYIVGGLAAMKLVPLAASVVRLGKSVVSLGFAFGETSIKIGSLVVQGVRKGIFPFIKMRNEASALGGKLVAVGKAAAKFGVGGMKTALAGLKSFAMGYHQLGERMKAAGFVGTLRMMKDSVVGFASAAKTSATGALHTLKDGFIGAAKAAAHFAVSGLKSTFASIAGFAKAVWASAPGALMALKVGFIAAAKAAWGFTVALLANPITWIIAAVAALAAAAYLIYKNWDWIGPWFKKLWDGVKHAFSAAWEWIKSAVSTAWNAIVNTIKSIFSPIIAYFDERIDAVKSAFDVGLIDGIQAIILNFHPARWIVDAMDALTKYLFDFSLKDAGINLINSMLDGLKSAWEDIVGWFGDIGKSIGGLIPESVTDVLKMAQGIGGGITDAASSITGGLADSIGSAFAALGGWLGSDSGPVPVEQSPALQMVQQQYARRQADIQASAKLSFEAQNVPPGVNIAAKGWTEQRYRYQAPAPMYNPYLGQHTVGMGGNW